MNTNEKIDLLLRAWLCDQKGMSEQDVKEEEKLVQEITEALDPESKKIGYEKDIGETQNCSKANNPQENQESNTGGSGDKPHSVDTLRGCGKEFIFYDNDATCGDDFEYKGEVKVILCPDCSKATEDGA